MNDQKETARSAPILEEGSPARPNGAADQPENSARPLIPVPSLLILSGEDAGFCTGDACALPATPRKAE